MDKSKSILITFAQGPIPRRIIYYGVVHLCTPHRARPEACTNCRAPGHRYDVCPEPKIPRCPRCGEDHGEDRTRQCVPRCILCGGKHLTGTGWCKATKRQQTTKPPVNREITGRRQLQSEDFPRWNPSAPPKAPEELTWAEQIGRKPDPRDEEMIRLREEVRSLRQAITQPHPSPVTQTITQPSHPPTGHPLPLDTQSSSPAETSTSIPPTKNKRKHVPAPSAQTTELEQSDKTAEMEAQFEAKLEAKLTAKLAHFQRQMRDEFQQFQDKRLQTLEARFPTLEARIDSLIDERFKILENKLDTFCTQLRTQMGLMVAEATNQMQAVPIPRTTHPPSTSQTFGQQNGSTSRDLTTVGPRAERARWSELRGPRMRSRDGCANATSSTRHPFWNCPTIAEQRRSALDGLTINSYEE
ncbi:hypothetical protein HPB49_020122 [Dermacentor silvarum]|uniref:Uncharacterized protein n=1 Tax=Dermacentor silvarum TaxID=543639 RepID=A0ACB8DQR2_DERSI|nr:hypothetical protein HPB49_020122 [Dermacentor silvarum]